MIGHLKHFDCLFTAVSSSVVFVGSIVGAVRTGSYMFHVLSSSGFRRSICDQSFYNGPISKFWAYAFVLSKAPELGQSFRHAVRFSDAF